MSLLKVTFKEPTNIWQQDIFMGKCIFWFFFAKTECDIITEIIQLHFSKEPNDFIFVFRKDIQSIEHIKPTDI